MEFCNASDNNLKNTQCERNIEVIIIFLFLLQVKTYTCNRNIIYLFFPKFTKNKLLYRIRRFIVVFILPLLIRKLI